MMDHVTKMLLIPQEAYQRFDNEPLNKLDKEMSLILQDTTLSDIDKWTKYNAVLQQFLHISQENRKPVQLPITESEPIKVQEKVVLPDTLEDVLISTVPLQFKRKAEQLYSLLKKSSDLEWTNDGALKIKGNLIRGANLVDLVNDVLRSRKKVNPEGWRDFALALRDLNVPQEFVGNKLRWNYMHAQRGSGHPVKRLKWTSFSFKK